MFSFVLVCYSYIWFFYFIIGGCLRLIVYVIIFLVLSFSLTPILQGLVPSVKADSEIKTELENFIMPLLAEGYTTSKLREALVEHFGDWRVWIAPNRYLELNRTLIERDYSITVKIPVFGYYNEPPPEEHQPPEQRNRGSGGGNDNGGSGDVGGGCACSDRGCGRMICPTSNDLKKLLIQLGLDSSIISNLVRVKPNVYARKIGNYLLIKKGGFYYVYVLSDVDVEPVQLEKPIRKVYKNWTINSYYQLYYSIGQPPKTPGVLGKEGIGVKPSRSINGTPGVDYYVRVRIREAFFVKGVSSWRYARILDVEVDRVEVRKGKLKIGITSNAEILQGLFHELPDVALIDEISETVEDPKPKYKWYFEPWTLEFKIAEQQGSTVKILNPRNKKLKYKLELGGTAYTFQSKGNVTYASVAVYSLLKVESEATFKLYVSRSDGDVLLHKVKFSFKTLNPVKFPKISAGGDTPQSYCYTCLDTETSENCDWLTLATEFATGFYEAGGVAGIGFILFNMPHPVAKAAGVVLIVAGSMPYFQSLYEIGVEYFNILIGEGVWAVHFYLSASIMLESIGLTNEAKWLREHAKRALLHLANLFIADLFGGVYAIREDFEIAFGFKEANCKRVARAQGRIAGIVTVIIGFIYSSYKAGSGLAKAIKDGLKRFGWGLATPAIYDLITIGYGGAASIKSSYLLRLLYSAEQGFVDRIVKVVGSEGVEKAKSRLRGLVNWVRVIFEGYSDNVDKARDLAIVADDVSKYSDDLANILGETVDDAELSRDAVGVLKKADVYRVRGRVSEIVRLIRERGGERAAWCLRMFYRALNEFSEPWNRYYYELLDGAVEKMRDGGRVYTVVVLDGRGRVRVPAGWGLDYVVVAIPGLGEEVRPVPGDRRVTVRSDLVEFLRDVYGLEGRVAVLLCPEEYNAGFIGRVFRNDETTLMVTILDEYLSFLESLKLEDLKDIGKGSFAVFEAKTPSGEETKFIGLINERNRVIVNVLKNEGFKLDPGNLLHLKILAIFDFDYIYRRYGGKVFQSNGYAVKFVELVEDGLKVEVIDPDGDARVLTFSEVKTVIGKRHGALAYRFGDGAVLEVWIDPEESIDHVKLFYVVYTGGRWRRSKVVEVASFGARVRDLDGSVEKVDAFVLTHLREGRIYKDPYLVVAENGVARLEKVDDPLLDHALIFLSEDWKPRIEISKLGEKYKREIYRTWKREDITDREKVNYAEIPNRWHWYLKNVAESGKDNVFTFDKNVKIPDKYGNWNHNTKQPDLLIFLRRDGKKYLVFGELKCMFVGENVRERIGAAEGSISELKRWLINNGYVKESGGVWILTEAGAEAINAWMRKAKGDMALPVWSVDDLKGAIIMFYAEIADSRYVIEDPSNEIFYEPLWEEPVVWRAGGEN